MRFQQSLEAVVPAPADDPGAVARLLGALREHLDMDVAYVARFEGTKRVFRYVEPAEPDVPIAVGVAHELADTYCQRTIDGRLPAVVTDAGAEPEVRDLPITREYRIGAHLCAPLVFSDGRVWGSVGCFRHEPDPSLRDRDARTVRVIAGLIAAGLEQADAASSANDERTDRIEQALTGENLTILFQPIVDLHSGSVVGAEALSRFRSEPYRPPNEWFADAEAIGMGVELELVAARAALAHLDRIPAKSYVSVNLSPPALRAVVERGVLERIDCHRVVIELTEHQEIDDYEAFSQALAGVRAKGCRIAVDDAGSGFASLRHILRINPDIIKLDLSLTRQIDTDPVRRALASSLTSFARATGARIVAEGIETPGELAVLVALGIRYGQGYHLARPGGLPLPVVIEAVDAIVDDATAEAEAHRVWLRERMQAVFERATRPMVIISPAGTLLHVNPALCELAGRTEDELLAEGWRSIIHPGDIDAGTQLIGQLLSGELDHFTGRARGVRGDGSTPTILIEAFVVRDDQQRPSFVFAEVRPIEDAPPHQ